MVLSRWSGNRIVICSRIDRKVSIIGVICLLSKRMLSIERIFAQVVHPCGQLLDRVVGMCFAFMFSPSDKGAFYDRYR